MEKIEFKNYPNTDTPIDADNLNLVQTNIETALDNVKDGWIPLNKTFTYSSADSPTFVMSTSVDLTGIVGLGMKIKLTQETTKYFIVTAITNNSITMYGGADYTLTNDSISNVYYSMLKAPFGFPMNADKWSIAVVDTTQRDKSSPSQNIWYNLGGVNITIPAGLWEVSYTCINRTEKSTSGTLAVITTLSTTNSSETDKDFSTYTAGVSTMIAGLCYKQKILNLSSKTIYYINTRTTITGGDYIRNLNHESALIIKAVCAYL